MLRGKNNEETVSHQKTFTGTVLFNTFFFEAECLFLAVIKI